MPMRFCIGTLADGTQCNALGPWETQRCPTCQAKATKRRNRRANTTQRGLGADHRRRAKEVLDAATVCHWCGKPFTTADPATADHVKPRVHGGGQGELVAAHRSCNSRRGGQTRRKT